MSATEIHDVAESAREQSPFRVAVWTILFYCAWYWRKFPDVLVEGKLPDTDDFQRLHNVRNWLNGQEWFDLTNYRMDPPFGADMHWSRLVDVPIALLVRLFETGFDPVTAERLATIVWPAILLTLVVLVMVEVCRRLDPRINPLLVLLLTVTSMIPVTQFAPGRIDHHSVQILLFSLVMLGLVMSDRRKGGWLIGAAVSASIAIGLDAILPAFAILGWLGLAWLFAFDRNSVTLRAAAIAILVAFPLLFLVSVPPSGWGTPACDAISVVYLLAFMAVGASFLIMAGLDRALPFELHQAAILRRLGLGLGLGVLSAGLVVALYPQCAAGPYGAVSAELRDGWLVYVAEAQPVVVLFFTNPQSWIAIGAYGGLMVVIAYLVASRMVVRQPAFLALFIVFLICLASSALQLRALRIGFFLPIPFCAVAAVLAWERFQAQWPDARHKAVVAQAVFLAILLSVTWDTVARYTLPKTFDFSWNSQTDAGPAPIDAYAAWREEGPHAFCNAAADFAFLRSLPGAYVLTDIDSGAPSMIHTRHEVVGGPYHRNGKAILDMAQFFGTDPARTREIAENRDVEYVAYCRRPTFRMPAEGKPVSLAHRIELGTEPAWLERLSARQDRLQVFRIDRQRLGIAQLRQ